MVNAGDNLGWSFKEGTFAFDPSTGNVSTDLTGIPAGLVDPILQYDHDEGISITGGFVYEGTEIPLLQGKYVFGDFTQAGFFTPGGRLFVADLEALTIEELALPFSTFVKSFGLGPDGEIYLLAGENLGPFADVNGDLLGRIYKISAVPIPAALWMLVGAFGVLGVYRRRRSGSVRTSAMSDKGSVQ